MKPSLVVWSLILLIGFWASDIWMAVYGEANLWMAWAIIFVIGYYAMTKTAKKMPKDVMAAWVLVSASGFLATFAVALGVVSVSFSFIMGLWLLLTGAALYVSAKDTLYKFLGMIYLFSGILVPTAFGASYFIGGALVFGLIGLIHSLLTK